MNLKQWHKEVCERDGYVCQVCKKSFDYGCYFDENGVNQFVCGHHLKTRGSRIDLEDDINNGVCVDFDCHRKLHSGEINYVED